MKVNKFEFISADNDLFYAGWNNWSRAYEYPIIINALGAKGIKSVHNTACGGSMQIHKRFADVLAVEGFAVDNTDIHDIGTLDYEPIGYEKYDILSHVNRGVYDAVLCVSTIEHIEANPAVIIDNLYKQVLVGGLLLITFDFPDVDLAAVENHIGQKCKDTDNRLSGKTSRYPDMRFEHLNIVYLEIEKI